MFQKNIWLRIIVFFLAASFMVIGAIALLLMFLKLVPYWEKLRLVIQYILDNPFLTGLIAFISFSLTYLLSTFAFSTEKKDSTD